MLTVSTSYNNKKKKSSKCFVGIANGRIFTSEITTKQMIQTMKATELQPNQKVKFTPTGVVFTIKKVTEKRISWWLGFVTKSGHGINNLRSTSTSIRIFQQGIDDGTYIIL